MNEKFFDCEIMFDMSAQKRCVNLSDVDLETAEKEISLQDIKVFEYEKDGNNARLTIVHPEKVEIMVCGCNQYAIGAVYIPQILHLGLPGTSEMNESTLRGRLRDLKKDDINGINLGNSLASLRNKKRMAAQFHKECFEGDDLDSPVNQNKSLRISEIAALAHIVQSYSEYKRIRDNARMENAGTRRGQQDINCRSIFEL
jgi:hypothetical protein